MKRIMLLLGAAAAASCACAKTHYVDCKLGDYTGHDGSSPELAFETLQDAASSWNVADGDTVEVARGVYNKGQSADHWWGIARVKVGGRQLRFHAPEGPEVTIIEGAYGSDAATGCGPGALKCIISEGDKACVFEGFSLRKGRVTRTTADDDPAAVGGAVHASVNGVSDWRNGLTLVGCVIEDCDAPTSGAVFGGTYVRCVFRGNPVRGDYAARHGNFVNCLYARNDGAKGPRHFQDCTLVNCTMHDNMMSVYVDSDCRAYNNLVSFSPLTLKATASGGNLQDSGAIQALADPLGGDVSWRAAASNDVRCAEAKYLGDDYVTVADGVDKHLDLNGTAIPSTGTIAAGAVQTGKAVAVSGAIELGSTGFSCGGRAFMQDAYLSSSSWPELIEFTYSADNGARVIHYTLSQGDARNGRLCPMMGANDPIRLLPPRSASAAPLRLAVGRATTNIVRADPSATAEGADGSAAHPFPTLQAAIDALPEGGPGLVIASAGTYQPGPNDEGVSPVSWNGTSGKVMVKITGKGDVRVVSEAGASKTFLRGRKDASTVSGVGADAVQAGYIDGSTAYFQGFTVTGCYGSMDRPPADGGPYWSVARALFYLYTEECHFADCVFENNVTDAYVLMGGLVRSTVRNNASALGVLGPGTKAMSSVVCGNEVTGSGGIFAADGLSSTYTRVYSCSVAGNTVPGAAFADSVNTHVVNTLLASGGRLSALGGHSGCVYDGFTSWDGSGYLKADPMFVAPDAGDLRILDVSPAIGAGVPAGDANDLNWPLHAPWNVDGGMLAVAPDGSVTPGAVAATVPGVHVTAEHGGVEVVNGRIGVNALAPGNPIVVRAAAGSRPVAGLVVNGMTNLFETLPDHQLAQAGSARIEALYLNRWHAATNGSDTALGFYPSCAKSLQGALAAAASGDTVVAAKGVYDSGTMIQAGDGYAIRARAAVGAGVTLVSESGRDETVIQGLAATADVEDAAHGLGGNAVRGVYLKPNSKVSGFTIRGGHTRERLASGEVDHAHPETTGGGVFGEDRATCIVEDCVLTGNAAYRGGNAFACTLVGCVTENGYATYIGGGLSNGSAYNTLSRNNRKGGHGAEGLAYSEIVESCTVVDALSLAGADSRVRNTACASDVFVNGLSGAQFQNCVFCKGHVLLKSESFDSETDRVREIDRADFGMDTNGVITTASASLVDRADAALDSGWTSSRDALGGQRVYNGARDIGAVEADWRGVYAADLRERRVTMAEATPGVRESDARKVRLADGARVAFTVMAPRHDYDLPFSVAGGELTVSVGGEATTYVADGALRLRASDVDIPVVIAYAGPGAAELGRIVSRSGHFFIFR